MVSRVTLSNPCTYRCMCVCIYHTIRLWVTCSQVLVHALVMQRQTSSMKPSQSGWACWVHGAYRWVRGQPSCYSTGVSTRFDTCVLLPTTLPQSTLLLPMGAWLYNRLRKARQQEAVSLQRSVISITSHFKDWKLTELAGTGTWLHGLHTWFGDWDTEGE